MRSSTGPRWTLDNLPLDRIDTARVRDDRILFYILTAASFVEISSDIYTGNLLRHYAGDAEVETWLARGWEPEEIRHGRVLKAYVTRAWPDFDWDGSYRRFIADYGSACTVEELESSRALEMAARCIVEMGTTTYYQAIHDYAAEPVARQMAALIRNDEIGHYKHFYRYFRRYRDSEGTGRLRVAGALWRRILEIRDGDADTAIWHIFQTEHPGASRQGQAFRHCFGEVAAVIRRHYPASMALKMALRPLALPGPVQNAMVPLANAAKQWLVQ